MSLLTLSNPTVSNVWNVVLDNHSEVENDLPLTFFNIKNGSSLTLIVHLNGSRVGIVEAYSMDTYIGKQFETFTITTKDGDNLSIDDVFVQVGNNIQMTTSPYNPTWDMMEENIDVYASGCDGRISYSTNVSANIIKYWINLQNALTVQRRLSIQGSASLGSYEITFNPETILAGGVPINGEVLDSKLYKKVIQDDEFNYSITNATIKGWMIDFALGVGDISNDYTIEIDRGGNGVNAYDNHMETLADDTVVGLTSYQTILELSFSSRTISHLDSTYRSYSASYYHAVQIDLKVNGSWVNIYDSGWDTYRSWTDLFINDDTVRNLVTGIRWRMKVDRGEVTGNIGIRDITMLE